MGDMKTPDFDDLLAAFDIPDMVDPKAAIESGHDDHDVRLRTNGHPDEDSHATSGSDIGVSVIVKNVRNHDGNGADRSVPGGNGLQNGSGNGKLQQGGGHETEGTEGTLNRFSPISSADECDEDDRIEVDDPLDRPNRLPCLRRNPHAGLGSKGEVLHLQTSNLRMTGTNGKYGLEKTNTNESPKLRKRENQPKGFAKTPEGKTAREPVVGLGVTNHLQAKGKSSPKLSSCIAAIAALSTKKSNPGSPAAKPLIPKQDSPREAKESPKVPEKLPEQESAMELAKKSVFKQPESPCSVTSENSSKGSPSPPPGSVPVVPKVRIKTIKTSSGQIKRTVTRVLPELDQEGVKKGFDSTSIVVSSILTSSPSNSILSPSKQTSMPTTVLTTSAGSAIEVTKPMTIKPVATAFLPVSAVKTAGSQVINLKLSNNTTVKATVIPAASVQSASNAILKAANAIQQQAVVVPASSLVSTKMVPKTVHLTNLNLLPHATSASELHQVLSKQAMRASQAPKKVSRVQVLASSQSSVVEAFNKVLSSINPVPVYVPNLCPPSSACISLPSRGYKCLECGDSFALEKSLTQHNERRSVRIEVTCNHCAKNLVFYNKCSLLSHARGHKDKGVVMQCSHLILKPIPADQMISVPSATSGAPVSSSGQGGSHVVQGRSETTVISAPPSAPAVPAMPPDEDPSRPRANVKCSECNETFLEESSLVMHYQQASDPTEQKTCPVCQMLLPNQCSFTSHQRIHQHKSPYVCPECGATCRSVHFQSHVTANCLHYTRRVGYRCVHCSVIFADVSTLKSHIQASHCEIFYKCPICPMAFKSAPGTHSHACTQHPGLKIGEPKLIYKCSMCDTVFTQQMLLYTHFDQHISSQKVSVFKCPHCSTHYAQRQLMLDHIKSTHKTLKGVDGPPNQGVGLPLSTKPLNSMNPINTHNPKDPGSTTGLGKTGRKPSPIAKRRPDTPGVVRKTPSSSSACPGWTCEDCGQLFTQREVFITHMDREHGKQLKKHPCRQCEKSFSSSHSLCRHNRVKHKGVRKVYTCPNCPDSQRTFTKRLLLEKHMDLTHGVAEPERKSAPESNSADEPGIKEQVRSIKRKLNSEGEDAEEEEDDEDEEPGESKRRPGRDRVSGSHPVKKLKVTVLKTHRCAVCGFTSTETGLFQKHLPQHKTDGSSHQCAQCGLCYTSRHSLARHLFIIHRLKEAPGAAAEQQENAPEVPGTQCRVCGKTFDAEPALNTHMRTHGMAFIKSKRLNAAEK